LSAIRSLIASTIRLFKKLRGASREEIIARCEGLKRQLEYRGMGLMKDADRFHREAVFFVKKKMLRAARAKLEVWSEYKSEAESCFEMATFYDKIRLRVLRAASMRDIDKISTLVVREFDKLLGELPDDPVQARYMLEGTIEALDNMMASYVESTPAPETALEVEKELKSIMESEEGVPAAGAPPAMRPEALGMEEAEAGEERKAMTKVEEVDEELEKIKRKVKISIGM